MEMNMASQEWHAQRDKQSIMIFAHKDASMLQRGIEISQIPRYHVPVPR